MIQNTEFSQVRIAAIVFTSTLPSTQPYRYQLVGSHRNACKRYRHPTREPRKRANSALEASKNARLEAEQAHKALIKRLQVGDFFSIEPSVGRVSTFPAGANCFPPVQTIEGREKDVVVLIDSHEVIFLPSLIAKGRKGGRLAASRLITEIKSYLEPL